MLKKLRLKFVCIIMIIMTVMMCVIFGMVIGFTWENLEEESIEELRQLASAPGMPHDKPEEYGRSQSWFMLTQRADGSVQFTGTVNPELYSQETLTEIWEDVSESRDQTGLLPTYDLRYFRESSPLGQRLVFLDISGQKAAMNSLHRVCIFVGVAAFGAMLVLSILLARWAVKPVEQAWEQQRQFVADASHELKTPLTVIMTNAELLQERTGDETARQQYSGSILTMARQMRGLVEGLLELARVDNGAVAASFRMLVLSDLTADGILPFEPLFFEKGLGLTVKIEQGLKCRGSASHLQQVLEILLDNALKYTAPGGEVEVCLRRQGTHALLSVAGPGDDISHEELKNIFKRFYRIDKARSRDGSYGLGLSIARSIIEEHRGRIWAESRGGINTFYVQLPMN